MTKNIILIAGPTASGKSVLAMEIAQAHQGVIINADAMQVYAGLPILTAQPSAADKAAYLHEIYEVLAPSERSSAGRWLTMAGEVLQHVVKQGKTPIFVGGTGLYFKALLEGIADVPPIPPSIRLKSKELYEKLGEAAFRAALADMDPESAISLKQNDKQRLIRAYEVALHTGKPLTYWQTREKSGKKTASAPPFRVKPILGKEFHVEQRLLMPPRDALYDAINKRFLRMMESGAVEEVQSLLKQNLDPDLPAMKIIGVREIAAWLRGEISKDEAIAKAQQATRNYAKRQVTWFRNQWADDQQLYGVMPSPYRGTGQA